MQTFPPFHRQAGVRTLRIVITLGGLESGTVRPFSPAHEHPAVHVDHMSGNIRCRIRGQKLHGLRHVLWACPAVPAESSPASPSKLFLAQHRCHRCLNKTRRHGVDRNAFATRPRAPASASIRSTRPSTPRNSPGPLAPRGPPRWRCSTIRAPTVLQHRAQKCLRQQKRSRQIDAQYQVPIRAASSAASGRPPEVSPAMSLINPDRLFPELPSRHL
jgi:hypothetical protein